MPAEIKSITEKQNLIEQALKSKKEARYIQILTRINGVKQLKNALRKVLDSPIGSQTPIGQASMTW